MSHGPGGGRRAAGGARPSLLPLLLVSLLIHLSLIGFPYGSNAAAGAGAARADGAARRSSLAATLTRAAPGEASARQAPRPASASPAVPEPAPRVAEASADDAPGAAPAADRPPAQAFYASNELTVKPLALGEPALDAGDGLSGAMVLTLWIDAQGMVVEVSVERSEFSDFGDFGELSGSRELPADRLPVVANAFRQLRFAPGELNGQRVGAVMRIEVSVDEQRLPIDP